MFNVDWLKTVTVNEIPLGKPKLVIIESTDSALKCLNILERNGILSAPVWDDATKRYIGSIDMHYIVELLDKHFRADEIFSMKSKELMEKREIFAKKPIKELFDLTSRNPIHKLKLTDSLYTAIHGMVDGSHVRRSFIFSDDSGSKESLVSYLSQAALVSYLGKHQKNLGDFVLRSVQEVTGHDYAANKLPVVGVDGDQLVFDAFKLMSERNVSGLAVLNETGALIGTLGIRDLKGLMHKDGLDLGKLQLSSRAYINYVKQLSIDEKHPAISVRPGESFGTLLSKFAMTHVHRLFVIDDDSFPVGVMSTIDVLRCIVKHEKK